MQICTLFSIDTPMYNLIQDLQDRFRKLVLDVTSELTSRQIGTHGLMKCIRPLPLRFKFTPTDDANKIMDNIFGPHHDAISNFIDYRLLRRVIMRLSHKRQLKDAMKEYVSYFSEFEKGTSVSALVECWQGRREMPPFYCRLAAKIIVSPNYCMLERLNTLRRDLCKKFLPSHHSEFALLHNNFISDGGVTVEWCIQEDLIPQLYEGIRDSKGTSFFEQNAIKTLYIREVPIYQAEDHSQNGMLNFIRIHARSSLF